MYKVKDVIMYQATTRHYKVGDVLEFGKENNYQAERVLATDYRMNDGSMVELWLEDKIKRKKKLSIKEMREVCDIL